MLKAWQDNEEKAAAFGQVYLQIRSEFLKLQVNLSELGYHEKVCSFFNHLIQKEKLSYIRYSLHIKWTISMFSSSVF